MGRWSRGNGPGPQPGRPRVSRVRCRSAVQTKPNSALVHCGTIVNGRHSIDYGSTAATAVPPRTSRGYLGATPQAKGLVRARAECVFTTRPLPSRGRSRSNDPCGKVVERCLAGLGRLNAGDRNRFTASHCQSGTGTAAALNKGHCGAIEAVEVKDRPPRVDEAVCTEKHIPFVVRLFLIDDQDGCLLSTVRPRHAPPIVLVVVAQPEERLSGVLRVS